MNFLDAMQAIKEGKKVSLIEDLDIFFYAKDGLIWQVNGLEKHIANFTKLHVFKKWQTTDNIDLSETINLSEARTFQKVEISKDAYIEKIEERLNGLENRMYHHEKCTSSTLMDIDKEIETIKKNITLLMNELVFYNVTIKHAENF